MGIPPREEWAYERQNHRIFFWIPEPPIAVSVGNDKPISSIAPAVLVFFFFFKKKVVAFWRGKWIPPPVQSQGQQPQQLEGIFFFFFKSILLPVCLPPSILLPPHSLLFSLSQFSSFLATFSIESQDRVDISTLHRNTTGSRLSPSAACNCRIPPIDHQLSLFPIDGRINFLVFSDSAIPINRRPVISSTSFSTLPSTLHKNQNGRFRERRQHQGP